MPLHPALVHLPLGLAFVMPWLVASLAVRLWRGRSAPGGWTLALALQALLVAGGLAALQSGRTQEDLVEPFVGEAAIHRHEAYAEGFLWTTGFALIAIATVRVLREGRVARTLSMVSVAGTLLVAALALRVGHAGGQLVYVHGAARAYAGSSHVIGAAQPLAEHPRGGDETH